MGVSLPGHSVPGVGCSRLPCHVVARIRQVYSEWETYVHIPLKLGSVKKGLDDGRTSESQVIRASSGVIRCGSR